MLKICITSTLYTFLHYCSVMTGLTIVCIPDETLTGSSQPESAALSQFNKSWAELTDWLTMLDNMVQNKRVVVADLDDINDNIGRLKVIFALI